MRFRTCLLYTTDVRVHRISFHVGATRATCPRAKLSQCEHNKISAKCSNSWEKLSWHMPMKIAWCLKNSILPIQMGTFKLRVLCFLFIYNINVSLGPFPLPSWTKSVASLHAWSVETFLQLKEMTGKGTTSLALSTSSRISITSAGVLLLSIVMFASRPSPHSVAMARLGHDVHITWYVACANIVLILIVHDTYHTKHRVWRTWRKCLRVVYTYSIRFFQRSYTPL